MESKFDLILYLACGIVAGLVGIFVLVVTGTSYGIMSWFFPTLSVLLLTFAVMTKKNMTAARIEVERAAAELREQEEASKRERESTERRKREARESIEATERAKREAVEAEERRKQEAIAAAERAKRDARERAEAEERRKVEEAERAEREAREREAAFWASPEGQKVRAAQMMADIERQRAIEAANIRIAEQERIAEIGRQIRDEERQSQADLIRQVKDL